jgi:hypothetical protein
MPLMMRPDAKVEKIWLWPKPFVKTDASPETTAHSNPGFTCPNRGWVLKLM